MGSIQLGSDMTDSCHSRVIRNQQNLYPRVLTAVAELLQYSSSRVELRDGFSS